MLRASFIGHDASRTGSPIALLRFLGWLGGQPDVSARLLLLRGGPLVEEYEAVVPTRVLRPPGALRRRSRRAAAALLAAFGVSDKLTPSRVKALPMGQVFGSTDVVVANSFPSAMALSASAGSIGGRCPAIVLHLHEMRGVLQQLAAWSDDGARVGWPDMLCNVMAKASLVVVPSRSAAADLAGLTGGTPAGAVPVRVVPEPVDVEYARSRAHMDRRSLGWSHRRRIVLGCGTPELRKGIDLFAELARVVHSCCGPEAHFAWLGGTARPAELNHAPVEWIPSVQEPFAYLGCADLLVVASREDPFPLVVLEAAALGTPTVCFDTCGSAEFVEKGAGVVVPGLSVAEMAHETYRLLTEPRRIEQLGLGAARLARRYDIGRLGPLYKSTLEEVSGCSPAP